MDLLLYLDKMVKEYKQLDPNSRKAQELDYEIEQCKDYLIEHGAE